MALVKVNSLPSEDQYSSSEGRKLTKVSGLPPSTEYDTSEEGNLGYLARGAARTGAGLGQGVLDLAQLAPNLLAPSEEQQRATEDIFSKLQGRKPDQELPEQGLQVSQKLRKALDEATGGYTAPQTEGERAYDNFARTIGAALPGGAAGVVQRGVLAALSYGAGNFMENLTGSENAGLAAAVSTPIMAILAAKGARSVYSPLYKEAQRAIPNSARVSARPIADELRTLGNGFKQSAEATEYAPIRTFIKNANKELAANPRTSVHRLWDLKRYASEKAAEAAERNFLTGKRANLRQQKAWLDTYNVFNNELHQYANTNPAFKKAFLPAEEAFKASKLATQGMRRYNSIVNAMGLSSKQGRAILGTILRVPMFGKLGVELGIALSKRGLEAAKSPTLRSAYGANVGRAAQAAAASQAASE